MPPWPICHARTHYASGNAGNEAVGAALVTPSGFPVAELAPHWVNDGAHADGIHNHISVRKSAANNRLMLN